MWPFKRRKVVSDRQFRRAFSQFISKGAMDELLKQRDRTPPPLEQAAIPYIILQVRDDDLAQVPGYLEKAFEAAVDTGGVVMSVMSSVVAVTFGIPIRNPDNESIDQRNEAVARLLSDLGPNVRVICGRADGLYGVVGSARRFSFEALIPDFSRILEGLLRTDFGNSAEV